MRSKEEIEKQMYGIYGGVRVEDKLKIELLLDIRELLEKCAQSLVILEDD